MIYTSYYGNIRNINLKKKPILISISRYTPPGIDCSTIKFLQPPKELLSRFKNGSCDMNEYTSIYLGHLKDNKGLMLKMVERLKITEKDVFFLCYERSSDFCHRHILRKELILHGIDIKEF